MNRLIVILLLLSSCSVKRSVISEMKDKTETTIESEKKQSSDVMLSINTVDLSKYAINASTIRTIEKLDTMGNVIERTKEEQITSFDKTNNITSIQEGTARSDGLETNKEQIKKDIKTFEKSNISTKFDPANVPLIVFFSSILLFVLGKTRSK